MSPIIGPFHENQMFQVVSFKKRSNSPIYSPSPLTFSPLNEMPSSRSILRRSPYLGLVCPSYKPFWYDGGDLLLIVKDHVFRLRHTTLSCSEIFRDMFTFAHPSPEESFDDCTAVHLTDEPQDWMLLLQCLDDDDSQCVSTPIRPVKKNLQSEISASFNSGKFWEKDEPSYDTIASVLRLATKYEIPEVRARAIAKLYKLWPSPTKLETMDACAFSPHRVGACVVVHHLTRPCHALASWLTSWLTSIT